MCRSVIQSWLVTVSGTCWLRDARERSVSGCCQAATAARSWNEPVLIGFITIRLICCATSMKSVCAAQSEYRLEIEQVSLDTTSQEEGLAPADRGLQQRGQAPLPDLFYFK